MGWTITGATGKVVRVKPFGGPFVVMLAIAAAAAVVSFRSVYEPDLGWHLAQGRENLSGRLVRTNVFSFTYPDHRQHYTSWLSETSAYAAWRLGGDAAIQMLQAVTVAAALSFVYLACRVQAAALPSLAILVLGFFVLEPRAIPRPHLVSFAGIAACSWLIQQAIASRSARPLWWGLPMVALWSNLHGECVFGVLLIGTFALAELARPSALTRRDAVRALTIAMGCTAALLLNPYGWGLLQYLYENVSVPQILSIAELQPAYLPTYLAFFVYVGVAVLLLLSLPRRLTLTEALTAVVFAAFGFRYLRLTPLVFLATAPMLAARLTVFTARGLDGRAMLATALAAAVFVSRVPLTTLVGGVRVGSAHPDVIFSEGALAFARTEGLNGPVFNSHNLGGWLAWTMYPDVRVFQDSRLQAYPPEHFRAILDASRSQSAWDALMSGVDWAVLSVPRPNALSGAGRFPPEAWATVHADEAVEILVRRNGRYAAIAARQ
jgi:hypothetical protein